jgi:hypothetical protein
MRAMYVKERTYFDFIIEGWNFLNSGVGITGH